MSSNAPRSNAVAEVVQSAGLLGRWFVAAFRVGTEHGFSFASRAGHLLNYQWAPAVWADGLDAISVPCSDVAVMESSCAWLGNGAATLAWRSSLEAAAISTPAKRLTDLARVLHRTHGRVDCDDAELVALWGLPGTAFEAFVNRHAERDKD